MVLGLFCASGWEACSSELRLRKALRLFNDWPLTGLNIIVSQYGYSSALGHPSCGR